MSASHRSNITVSVRVRPLTPAESAKSCWPTVELLDGQHVKVCPGGRGGGGRERETGGGADAKLRTGEKEGCVDARARRIWAEGP